MKIELRDERTAKALTGLKREEFLGLVRAVDREWLDGDKRPLTRRKGVRKIRYGGGRKGHLVTASQKLCFILFWLKVYPTYDLLAFMTGMDRSQACRWVHALLPIIEKVLDKKLLLPERKTRNLDEFKERFPGMCSFVVDGTERPVNRPKNYSRRKHCYSGKKKCHTVKNIIAIYKTDRKSCFWVKLGVDAGTIRSALTKRNGDSGRVIL